MLKQSHQNFLGKFFKADDHYTQDEAPIVWLKNSNNVTSRDISNALNDSNYNVRAAAIQHPNATKEHISKALNDSSNLVRETAIQHPNATKEHIDKALVDADWYV